MNIIELSSRKNGKRKFKAILHQIFPDSCIDEVNQVGTQYNENGITWIESYCEAALPTLIGKSIRCEFLDEERTEICGHGMTDIIDGVARFENASMIGVFTNGYIDSMEINGEKKRVLIGEGELDEACYTNFVTKLEEDMANGIYYDGSIEAQRTGDNDGIVYLYGYKEKGRIPKIYEYSGFALLSCEPADDTAKLIELNNKEENPTMNENEVKALIADTVAEINNVTSAIAECKADCNAKVAEANSKVEAIVSEKNELEANVEQIQAALDAARAEFKELDDKYNALFEECDVLRKALGEAQARERIAELNDAIAKFSEAEQNYAKDEIEAFKANPVETEINSVVNKIYQGIGENAKKVATNIIAEQNSKLEVDDIFAEVSFDSNVAEEIDIFKEI